MAICRNGMTYCLVTLRTSRSAHPRFLHSGGVYTFEIVPTLSLLRVVVTRQARAEEPLRTTSCTQAILLLTRYVASLSAPASSKMNGSYYAIMSSKINHIGKKRNTYSIGCEPLAQCRDSRDVTLRSEAKIVDAVRRECLGSIHKGPSRAVREAGGIEWLFFELNTRHIGPCL